MKKLTSILLILAITLTFTACKKEPPVKIDFSTWFNNEFITAYDTFTKTEYGTANIPFPTVSDMLITANINYIDAVFKFIADGSQPKDGGKVTEANGIYTYTEKDLIRTIEFDNNTCSMRVTASMILNGEIKSQFNVTIREKDDVFYIQYLASEFRTYHEISFTASSGNVKTAVITDLPYSIFAAEIPETFAKES